MMRKTLFVAIAAGSLFIIHCSSSGTPHLDAAPAPSASASSTPTSTKTKTPPKPTTTPTSTEHPPKTSAAPDAGTHVTGPGPNCQALSTCCSKITNSTQQTSCLQTAGKANETVCTSAQTTFACSTLTGAPPTRGPSCTGLTSGALYCGNDGPSGDPETLYRCTGTTISISRVCPNGCTTNAGVDDACAASGTTPPPAVNVSCQGLSGDYCGTDSVGGNANTLYSCANDTIANTTICQNGCVTNPDVTLNDTCAAPPTTTTPTVSCTGLNDESYCGTDLGGDPDTLYTCAGGTLTTQKVCTSGCTVAAANVSDFCTGTTAPDCAGLSDGFYCGNNGVGGDSDTLYQCTDDEVQPDPIACTFGCVAGDLGGDDGCE